MFLTYSLKKEKFKTKLLKKIAFKNEGKKEYFFKFFIFYFLLNILKFFPP